MQTMEDMKEMSTASLLYLIFPNVNCMQLDEMIEKRSLVSMSNVSSNELLELDRLSASDALGIMALFALYNKYESETLCSNCRIYSSGDVYDYMSSKLRGLDHEEMHIMMITSKLNVIGTTMVARGTINSLVTMPRDIIKTAISCGAYAIIMIHNHPSGDPTPSKTDIETTSKVYDACEMVGIHLYDHVIMGDSGCFSMAIHGMIKKCNGRYQITESYTTNEE